MVNLTESEIDGISDFVKELIGDMSERFGQKEKLERERLTKMERCHENGGCNLKSRKACFECMDKYYSRMHY